MRYKLAVRLVLMVVILLLAGSFSAAKGPKRMAILPFTMNADRDLTFLQEGIVDMLASRLAWKGELEVLEKSTVKAELDKIPPAKGALTKDVALAIGRSLQADYVIMGSLTVFGDSVSVDSRIWDVAKSEELVTAFNQAKGMDAVIPTITRFAEDVNEKVMGRPMAGPVQQAAAPEGPAGPGGLIGAGKDFEGKGVSHTQGYRAEIVSMDVGDVDGDGKNEMVFASPDTVFVNKWGEKGFVQFKTFKERFVTGIVYVSVADLDGNGKAEIYVSNLGDTGVSSLVLEWDGNNFKKIAEKQQWFFRVMDMPGKGKVLLGQKRETGGSFLGGVQFLRREGSGYVSTGEVPVHRFANIFNFALVDFTGTGKIETVLLDHADRVRLYEPGAKEEVWKSEEPFGGTYTFLKIDSPSSMEKEFVFFSSPVSIVDVDEDGKKEVMVCKNNSSVGRLLGRFNLFSSGSLYFLARDETGLSTKWTTKKLGGTIVGYKIADVDGDNLPELVIASVIREERMLGNPRSRVVVYDLK